MPFKTFTAGDVLTASDVNTFLMNQSVIVCTSSTRPSSPVEGQTIYETDTDVYKTYTGSVWVDMGRRMSSTIQSFTATFNNFTLGNGTSTAYFNQIGRLVHAFGEITLGSTSVVGATAGTTVQVNFPVALQAVAGVGELAQGTWNELIDISAGLSFQGLCRPVAAGIEIIGLNTYTFGGGGNLIGGAPINTTDWTVFTWDTGDIMRWSAIYAGQLSS